MLKMIVNGFNVSDDVGFMTAVSGNTGLFLEVNIPSLLFKIFYSILFIITLS